jgi:shikimate 5-dehydrogenase
MLIAQAVGQFEAWTGVPAPEPEMLDAAARALAEAVA